MSRTAVQNEKMREARREKILSAAVRLFATRGLQATKVSDIARASGMSQGLLYHYFDSKEAIYVDIVRQAFARMNRAAKDLEQEPMPPREKLELAVGTLLGSLARGDDFAWFSALISLASISDAVPEKARGIIKRNRLVAYRVVERIVVAGQKDGSVRPGRPVDLALLFWTNIKGLAMHRLALGNKFEAPEPSALTALFFEGEAS